MATRLKMRILFLSLTALAAVVSFATSSYILGQKALASDDKRDISINVASLDEASASAGYQVTTPVFIPPSFEKRDTILVMQLHIASEGPESKPVEQEWISEDGSWFSLIQLPGLDLPTEAESIQIGAKLGKKVIIPANPTYGLPATLVLYWQDGTRGYSLGGSLTKSLNEETLLAIADSVE